MSAPQDADLFLEMDFAPATRNNGQALFVSPKLHLLIRDPKTREVLWGFTEYVEPAFLQSTWDRNFEQAMSNLVGDVEKLVGQATAAAAGTASPAPALPPGGNSQGQKQQ